MNPAVKAVIFWLVVGVSALLLFQIVHPAPRTGNAAEISYSRFISEAEAGNIASVTIRGNRIQGQFREGKGAFQLTGPNNSAAFLGVLHDKGVDIWFKDSSSDSSPLNGLGTWAPLILLAVLWFFMIRQMQRRNSPPSVGTSEPRRF